MRGNQQNEFTNGGFNEFQKQIGNILNHVETFVTFDALDNVSSGYSPGCDVPSIGIPLASCSSRISGLYLDVFESVLMINRAVDAQLYLDVYRKYSRVYGKVPCVQQDMGLRGDGLDKRELQPSGHSDVFEAYLALCSSGAGSWRSRSVSQITTDFNSNLAHTGSGSQNSYPVSRDGGNTRVNCQLSSTIGVSNNGSSASRRARNVQVRPHLISAAGVPSTSRRTSSRFLTSASTVDTTSVASAGGRIQMRPPREPLEYIKSLFGNKHFKENIRAYNKMFAMTSFGAKIDESINAGRGPYVFKVSGQIYHWIGSLCPPVGEAPRFLQLYIYDTDNERTRHSKIRLYNAEGARGYELPTSNTLGAKVFERGIADNADFDVIIQHRDDPAQRVNKLHPLYMSLQFPLLLIYGQPGYQLHFRLQQYDLLFRVGRLFQQYIVGVLCADFIRKKQNDIRSDYLSGLYDAISRGERDGYEVGGRIIVPMYFTSGLRYMYTRNLDALAIFRKLGNPQFFITFTCNVNWPEIKRFMSEYPHLTASDRANVVCRVFKQKIQALISFLIEECIFGNVTGVLYTVEFQKRELLHCHTLLWVDSASRIRIAEDVDRFISAELPDPRIDPKGYNVVSELMMHGPCEAVNLKAACMKGDKCSKKFLKNSIRRPSLMKWSCALSEKRHKYISRGTNRVFARVSRAIGELSTKATPSPQFDIHHREPAIQILAVYLEDMHRITFRDKDSLKSVIDLPGKKNTTLTEWFASNEANEVGRNLSYLEFPLVFVWYSDRKSWSPRKNSKLSIGRLAHGYPLYEIEIILSNCGKSLHAFGRPPPPQDLLAQLANRLLMEERNYNQEELAQLNNGSVLLLNSEQKQIYDHIINADANNRQALIFVYGHGGTGKTFLWKTIISSLCCEGKIVLAVASPGIASLLLPSGRTAHSKFKLPLELTEESLCRITKNTQIGKLLADVDLIIWDEAPMNDHCCFEALDRSLRDIVDKLSSLFGGNYGKIGEPAEEDPENTSWVHISPAYFLPPDEQGLSKLINFIYDKSTLHTPSATTLQQKAIICPKNETADIINLKVLAMVPGESTIYMSQDEATPTGDGAKIEMLYLIEHLNTFKLSGFPPHQLELKVGAPVMLLRDVNIADGLCNDTRMIVRQLMTKLIEVQIITGTKVGEKVFILRIPLIHKDPNLPFVLKRKQFPIKLCYAMTIKKSQGQSLNKIGVYLPHLIFGHGHLYVASSRSTTPHGLKILIELEENQPLNATKNIGNDIQANMALKDTDYFYAKLEMHMAYRISNFSCEATSRFQQTLENETSLRFSKYKNFDSIPTTTFPHHYFRFISYN
ncbi:DNA helicase [Tanacetum coccineum]|uniref:ATP-dependent DNA helicase n=1 Tax=Tanacetum coccineum TaxID=301880 RepID=A0ABQ5GS82_9ASTR